MSREHFGCRPCLLVSVTFAAFAGCGREALPGDDVVMRDSAGIVIVENRVAAPGLPVWSLIEPPAIDIGGDEADSTQQLFTVAGAARLADGRIVVAEDGNSRLRFYDASGVWIMDAGRAGDGPGEFRDVSRPWVIAGDSIVLFDVRLRRFTLLSPTGDHVRNWPLEQPLPDEAVTPTLLMQGGEWLARPGFTFSSRTPTGIHRTDVPYLRFAFDGTWIDSIGRYAASESYVYSESEGDQSMAMSLPFLHTSRLAPAEGGGFWFGSSDEYEIERLGADGHLSAILRGTDIDNTMPSGRIAAWVDDVLAEVEPEQRPLFNRVFGGLPEIGTLPAYSALVTDAAGRLWVRDHVWSDEARVTWRIFGPDGAAMARIEVPAALSIDQIGDDRLLGTWTDELGIEHVQLYSFERGSSSE